MTPKIVSGIGMVLSLSALAVLGFSLYRSINGIPSQGLSIFGTSLLLFSIGLRMLSRRESK